MENGQRVCTFSIFFCRMMFVNETILGKERYTLSNMDTTCVNAIRVLAADAVQKANSGHPGLPLGSAAMAYELWANHMNHNPKNPQWANRDRFILSGGHGSTLLYSLLHFFGCRYGDGRSSSGCRIQQAGL